MAVQLKNYYILHYHFDKVAGTERVLYNLIEHLCKQSEIKVHLILLKEKHPLVFNIQDLPIQIHFLNIDNYTKSSKSSLIKTIYKTSKSLKNLFNNNEKSILLTTNVYLAYAAFLTKNINNFSNLEIVSCEHFTITATSNITNIFRYLFYSKINVVMLTETDRDFIQNKYKPKVCVCIPNAIPFDLQTYKGITSKNIIAIGRYTKQKGFDLLIESFALISKEFSDWKLQIIGDDYGDKPLLQQLITKHQLHNVELLPATNQIKNYYENASFYVMSSRFEGLPMVLLEALGFGLPIVSFNCPTGPAQVVSNKNGILVENGNVFALAEAIKLMINDENQRKNKAKGAEEVAHHFSKEHINILWDDFFKEI